MKTMMNMKTMNNMTSVLAMAFSLAACGKAGTSGTTSSPTANTTANAPAATAAVPLTGDAAILAAAEPFEKLTETAFAAAPPSLDATIDEVRTAAANVRGQPVGEHGHGSGRASRRDRDRTQIEQSR